MTGLSTSPPTITGRIDEHFERLSRPVDGASLAVFRIAIAFLVLVDVFRLLMGDGLRANLIDPPFHFRYFGFGWLPHPPGYLIYAGVVAMGVAAVSMMLGWRYRVGAWALTVLLAWFFLLEEATYLNHFYLLFLMLFLLALTPVHQTWSLDARAGRIQGPAGTVPAWALLAFKLALEIVLLYAGIVKLTPDWLAGQPLTAWLEPSHDHWLLGPLVSQPWSGVVGSWGVIILHLVGAPLLFSRRLRGWVIAIYATFHLTNHMLFNIGIFPFMTIAGTLLFLDPDWPRRLGARLSGKPAATPLELARPPFPRLGRGMAALLVGFLVFQALFPLRHYLYPGNVAWTEEGHRFAWRMKLRDKEGWAIFRIRDPETGRNWVVNPLKVLASRQYRQMVGRPDMIVQFAHYLEERWERERGLSGVEVRATVMVSLNGREPKHLVDPERDLTDVTLTLGPADWITEHPGPLQPRPELAAGSR